MLGFLLRLAISGKFQTKLFSTYYVLVKFPFKSCVALFPWIKTWQFDKLCVYYCATRMNREEAKVEGFVTALSWREGHSGCHRQLQEPRCWPCVWRVPDERGAMGPLSSCARGSTGDIPPTCSPHWAQPDCRAPADFLLSLASAGVIFIQMVEIKPA